MQLFGEVEGQFPGTLRLDDGFVLRENLAMLGIQLFVRFSIAVIAPGEPEKSGLVIRHRRAQINIGMAFVAAGLAALDDHHERQDDGIAVASTGSARADD